MHSLSAPPRYRRYRRLFVLWIAVVALVFSACGGGEESSPRDVPTATTAAATPSSSPDATPRSGRGDGDTLRLFYWQAPTTLNPHLSVGSKDQAASRIVYEPLATYDARGVMVPFLAAEIPSVENGGVAADGRSVTWKLRHGVNWADGEQFTADDVLFTYEYITNPQVGAATAGDYAGIERLEIIDDYTVRIHFKDVTPAWSDPFVGVRGMILPRHIFEPFAGANAAAAPANLIAIGTGPYMVSEYINEDTLIIGGDAVSTNRIIFTPNLYFREPNKPFFSAVELHGGGDAALAGQAVLVEGIADFAWNIQIEAGLLEQMLAVGKGVGVNPSAAFVEYILINFTDPNEQTTSGERSSLEYPHPFLTDERVRQAIAHAVDRDAIHALYGDTGPISTNVLTAPPQFESATPYPYPYYLERAKQLLDEAGWIDTNGDGVREKAGTRLRVTYQTSINPVRNATQEIVKAALEQIGFEVELKSIDASIFLGPVGDNTNTRRHFYADLEMFAYGGRSPDPGAAMQAWTCAQIAQQANNWGGANWGRYCNPEYDALYAQVVHELDPAKRQELFIQMNDLLIADVALIPIVKRPFTSAVANDITGLDPTPWDQDVWNIKDWRRT